jgi:hypothetical protein
MEAQHYTITGPIAARGNLVTQHSPAGRCIFFFITDPNCGVHFMTQRPPLRGTLGDAEPNQRRTLGKAELIL